MAQPSSAASAPNVQVAALQERLNEKLNKRTTAFCDLPLGHEQAIRIVARHQLLRVRVLPSAADAMKATTSASWVSRLAMRSGMSARRSTKSTSSFGSRPRTRSVRCEGCGSSLGWPAVCWCGTLAPLSARMHQVDVGLRLLVPRLRHTKGCSVSVSKHTCRLVRVTPCRVVCGGVRVGL